MSYPRNDSTEYRIITVVQQLLARRSINHTVSAHEDLRAIGFTSLDMINLVLSVEGEFNLTVPESSITPANFRSVEAISKLIAALSAQA